MDHFQTFDPSRLQCIQIPYLCYSEFEDTITKAQAFTAYPRVTGYAKGSYLDLTGGDHGRKAAFLQNWLYFGLLGVALSIQDIALNRADFIRKEEGKSLITSSTLNRYLIKWTQSEREKAEDGRAVRMNQIRQLLAYARDMVVEVTSVFKEGDSAAVLLSIRALGFSITHSMKQNWPFYFIGLPPTFGPGETLLDRLRDQKWCPHDISILRDVFYIDSQYYCSTFKPPRANLSHDKCSDYECRALNVDDDTYRTKHYLQGCSCVFVEMPEQKLHEMVADRKIPLTRYIQSDTTGSSGTLEIVENNGEIENVAISHVWADGLGNTSNQNSLPSCQLARLQKMVNELYQAERPVAFYIDTLCVPRNPQYKKLAIQKMRDAYLQAGKVLVLDSDIESASASEDITALTVRMVLSGWFRRLWTLQEGVLNSSLYFKLRDSAVPIQNLQSWRTNALREDGKAEQYSVVMYTLAFLSMTMQFKNMDDIPKSMALAVICDALRWRATSHAEDETICLATLLGEDPLPFLNVDAASRMPLFLQTIKKIPPALLVMSGDRLQQAGFTWAPRSLLGSRKHDFRNSMSSWYSNMLRNDMGRNDLMDHKVADVQAEGGLRLKAPGYEVRRQGEDEIGPVYWVLEMISLHEETQLPICRDVYRITFMEDEGKMPASLKEITLFYMICIDEKARSFAAILVLPDAEALAEGSGCIRCKFYCRLQITCTDDLESILSIEPYRRELLKVDGTVHAHLGNHLQSQQWHIV